MMVSGIGLGLIAFQAGEIVRDARRARPQAAEPSPGMRQPVAQTMTDVEAGVLLQPDSAEPAREAIGTGSSMPSTDAMAYEPRRGASAYEDAVPGYAARGASTGFSQPDALAVTTRYRRATEPDYPYHGASGARYRYDLSNPGDAIRYSVDPGSQLKDSISVDPRREIDQGIGQYGGGIER